MTHSRLGRPLAVGALLALVASCSGADPGDTARRTDSPSASSTATSGDRPTRDGATGRPTGRPSGRSGTGEALPDRPSTDAGTLARQLDAVVEVVRDQRSSAAEVRRAGELHQLAVHALVTGSEGFRRRVLGALRPPIAGQLRRELHAAELLRGLTSPQPRLPDWRIVEPPPAEALLGHYRAAERRLGVPWEYLAAIHLVETRMGRIRGTSSAGAQGPMQFIPSTWDIYGAGGDINDPRDAIMAAARLLEANGAPGDMANALYHYNPHDNYVQAVTAHARVLEESPRMYRSYWSWRVLYRHADGTRILPVGYPEEHAVPVRR